MLVSLNCFGILLPNCFLKLFANKVENNESAKGFQGHPVSACRTPPQTSGMIEATGDVNTNLPTTKQGPNPREIGKSQSSWSLSPHLPTPKQTEVTVSDSPKDSTTESLIIEPVEESDFFWKFRPYSGVCSSEMLDEECRNISYNIAFLGPPGTRDNLASSSQ